MAYKLSDDRCKFNPCTHEHTQTFAYLMSEERETETRCVDCGVLVDVYGKTRDDCNVKFATNVSDAAWPEFRDMIGVGDSMRKAWMERCSARRLMVVTAQEWDELKAQTMDAYDFQQPARLFDKQLEINDELRVQLAALAERCEATEALASKRADLANKYFIENERLRKANDELQAQKVASKPAPHDLHDLGVARKHQGTQTDAGTLSVDDQRALDARRGAAAEALERKRRLGQYAVIWRDGQVMRIEPEENIPSRARKQVGALLLQTHDPDGRFGQGNP